MKYSRFLLAFTLSVSTLLLLSQCGGNKDIPQSQQVFSFNEVGEVNSLDPVSAGSFENNWALNQLYNGLVEMDTDLYVRPCLAKNWEITDDGLEYTFHLRTDILFHDNPQFAGGKGRHVNAGDFVYSFNRLFDKHISSATALVEVIDHDPENGKNGMQDQNDSTLIIKLKKPFKPFLGILSMKFFSVVPKEVVQFYNDDFRKHPVGTGPFKLKYWNEKTNLVLEKNTSYFKFDEQGIRLPYLDLVSVSFIQNPESAFMQFMSGDLDMISGIDAISKETSLEKDGTLKPALRDKCILISAPYLKTDYMGILIDNSDANDVVASEKKKYLRRAINYAIDRDKIVRYRRNNLGTAANFGFLPPDMHAYDPQLLDGFSYNPDKAREMLKLAGYPDGKGLKPIQLTTTASYLDIADEIVHQLNEIGIPATVDIMQPTPFKSAVAEGKLGFFRKSWICDYPDPENFMALFYSKHFSPEGPNYSHFKHDEFDRLYERCLVEQNDSIRSNLFLRMDQIIVNESPVVPLYYDRVVRLLQKNISGMSIDPTNSINLERVKKN
jgi:oligopeptide transport system substrate-binding protein